MFRLSSGFLVCLFGLACFVGCGDSDTGDGPATVAASATVTYDGKLVEGAVVTFKPQGQGTTAAFGKTDAQGRVTLRTQYGEGAVPGTYTVLVSKTVTEGGSEDEEDAEEDPEATGPPPKVTEFLPVKYKDGETSDLTVTVREGEANEFPLELTD